MWNNRNVVYIVVFVNGPNPFTFLILHVSCVFITPASSCVYIPGCGHSQRQASTSPPCCEGASPSAPSRATLGPRPGPQAAEETAPLHPWPARLGGQLHGSSARHQGLPAPEQRHQRGGHQAPGSHQRHLLPDRQVCSSAHDLNTKPGFERVFFCTLAPPVGHI